MIANRRIALLVAALPFLIAILLLARGGGERLFPDVRPADVGTIELLGASRSVTLARQGEGWIITSAADAPGDKARIETTLTELVRLSGRANGANRTAATTTPPPLRITLRDADGATLGVAGLWEGEGTRMRDGAPDPRLTINDMPALPAWPSAWSSLEAPAITPDMIVSGSHITIDGPQPLSPDEMIMVARMLSNLSPRGFVAASDLNWAGARLLQVKLRDGATIDVQIASNAEGETFLRLTSDDKPEVRDVRHYAFATPLKLDMGA